MLIPPSLASSLRLASVAASFAFAGFFGGRLQAGDNWTQFRGPSGDGRSDAKELPVTFGESERVKWKTAIQGKAWSSPVICQGQSLGEVAKRPCAGMEKTGTIVDR